MDNTATNQSKISSAKIGYSILTALALLSAFIFASAAMTALIYFGASIDAFHSAMIGLLLFGVALLLSGICVFLVAIAVKILRRHLLTSDKHAHSAIKKSDMQLRLEKIFSFSNVTLALLAVGAVLIFASAGLGCTDRDNWIDAMSDYREDHGYYANGVLHATVKYSVGKDGGGISNGPEFYLTESDPLRVELQLINKRVMVVFDSEADTGWIKVSSFNNYYNQIAIVNYSERNTLLIAESPTHKHNDATARLILGMSDALHDNLTENTVVITLNKIYKGLVTVEGGDYEIV